MRYGSDQVKGRHPYLETRASCCGFPFTPKSRKIKVSEAIMSAGILWVLRRRKPTPAYTPVAQSVSRLPGTGGLRRMTSGTCQLCARSKRRSGSPSVTRREAESQRCETDQVKGRHPYLVTRAAVLWSSLHAHKSGDKGS